MGKREVVVLIKRQKVVGMRDGFGLAWDVRSEFARRVGTMKSRL